MSDIPEVIEVEKELIAAAIMDPVAWESIKHLTADHFYDMTARQCFVKMRGKKDLGRDFLPEDFIQETQYLMEYLGETSLYYGEHVRRIEDAYTLRTAYLSFQEGLKSAWKGDLDAVRNWKLELPKDRENGKTLSAAAGDFIDRLQAGDDVVRTGFTKLDHPLVEMLHRGDMIVLAARPSMGKSQLAFQVAYNVARNGGKVLIASLEMTAYNVAGRMATALTGYGTRDRSAAALGSLAAASSHLAEMENVRIMDKAYTMTEVYREAHRIGDLDLIVSDHLHLFKDHPDVHQVERLGLITRSQANLAKELDVPFLSVVQLSRASEVRDNKRPELSDLRGSGEIEQNADVIAFIYRDAYYSQDASHQDGLADIYTKKNRSGPLWRVQLWWDAKGGGRFLQEEREALTYQYRILDS